jgi:hypothetical protein
MRLTTGMRVTIVTALVAGGAAALPPAVADAATLTATLVATTNTGAWATPSPDPSGISYDAARQRLVLSDSEVDEMPLYKGTNVFFSTLKGVPQSPVGWTTEPWSYEPAGISFVSSSLTLISDDDQDKIFFVSTGANGVPGSATPPSFSTRPTNGDPEDVTLDTDATANGHILIIDGHNNDFHDYSAGPNGRFDGVAPAGDDVRLTFDVGQFGALDPEGIKYYPGRNTVLVLDSGSKKVYELDRQGRLLNSIDISAAKPKSAAGITLAPPSNGGSGLNFYISDRGVDNNTNAAENDGRFYEMAVNLPPIGNGPPPNSAPAVNAGANQSVTLADGASLAGTVTDDGLPTPPGSTTSAWSKVSGPGTVTFANGSATSTTATFGAAGTYVLRLTANDGALSASSDVTVTVAAAGGGGGKGVVDVPVKVGTDDAEEKPTGGMRPASGNLNMTTDGTVVQTVGLRFAAVPVPAGATITRAYVQFQVDTVSTAATSLTIAGQAADNPPTFGTVSKDISSRPRTSATVPWNPAPWPTAKARGVDQQTPNLSAVVQQIVSRGGWANGQAIVLVITGTGARNAEAFEGGAAKAPVLHIEYTTP